MNNALLDKQTNAASSGTIFSPSSLTNLQPACQHVHDQFIELFQAEMPEKSKDAGRSRNPESSLKTLLEVVIFCQSKSN